MHHVCYRAVAGLGLLAVLGGAPAMATDPASEVHGVSCVIDLSELDPSLSPVTTFDTHKLCTGSLDNENIKLECFSQIPWDAGKPNSLSKKGVDCQIFGGQCNVPGTLTATVTSMSLMRNSSPPNTASVSLVCQFHRNQ